MKKSIIHKFRVSGMHDNTAVTAVKSHLSSIPGIGSIYVNLRKMQVEVVASHLLDATQLRKALAGTECTLYELITSVKQAPPEIRDDSAREQ